MDHRRLVDRGTVRLELINDNNKKKNYVSPESKATEFTDVHDPATNQLLCRTPKSTKAEMESAVESATNAYEKWRNTSVLTRQGLMLKYQALIREHSVDFVEFFSIEKKYNDESMNG